MRLVQCTRASNTLSQVQTRAVLPAVVTHVHVQKLLLGLALRVTLTLTGACTGNLPARERVWPSAGPRRPAAEAYQAKGGFSARLKFDLAGGPS